MDRWCGKVAIVTGASSGIGAAIAEKLVNEGIQVAGFARRKEKLQEVSKRLEKKKGRFYPVIVDISKEDQILDGFKWVQSNLGPVHILVNNAGIVRSTNLIDGDSQQWKETFDTNVFGLCVATREAVKSMRANKIDGHIVHINSITGHFVVKLPNMNVYPASKFAVTALAETLRHELVENKLKIKITSISPGVVNTDLSTFHDDNFKNTNPTLKAEDIAEAVRFALNTPPHVNVTELTIRPVGETLG